MPAVAQLCKQRMVPRRQERWLRFQYCLECAQLPIYYGLFGLEVMLLPFLLGIFVLQCFLPFRWAAPPAA